MLQLRTKNISLDYASWKLNPITLPKMYLSTYDSNPPLTNLLTNEPHLSSSYIIVFTGKRPTFFEIIVGPSQLTHTSINST